MTSELELLRTLAEAGRINMYQIIRTEKADKQLVFYKVDNTNKKVAIYAVVNSKQEYRNLI